MIQPENSETWARIAKSPDAGERLLSEAASAYTAVWADADLVTFTADGVSFLFDTAGLDGDVREPRTVAAWSRTPITAPDRDASRQRGHPLAPSLAALGYERGHLIGRGAGGGMDANLFPQARQLNRGWSEAGKEYRRLEQRAASTPGALVFARLVYRDTSTVPYRVHLLVALPDASIAQGMFDNTPSASSRAVERLEAGTAFHRRAQTQFIAGLVGAQARAERTIRLFGGRTGRVDLLAVTTGQERIAVVVEIKNTDWDALPDHRVRPNLRGHIRQLQHYLDVVISQLESRGEWDSAAGVLLYPKRPHNIQREELIVLIAEHLALMVAWYDEADWSAMPND